jgi:hypothetical protein
MRGGRSGGKHPVGEKLKKPFQLAQNASLKIACQALRVTSEGGLILVRELDERLGLNELNEQFLTDFRGKNTQLAFAEDRFPHERFRVF